MFIDPSWQEIEFECPQCEFFNTAFVRNFTTRGVVICRGCKASISFDEVGDSLARTQRALNDAMSKLVNAFKEPLIKSFVPRHCEESRRDDEAIR
jgi:hypothetical protein